MQSLPSICDKRSDSVLLRLQTGETADCTRKWRAVTEPSPFTPSPPFLSPRTDARIDNKTTRTDQSSHEKEFLELVWQGVARQGIGMEGIALGNWWRCSEEQNFIHILVYSKQTTANKTLQQTARLCFKELSLQKLLASPASVTSKT